MLTHGATHRGSPFVGRNREIGIMTHLVQEGLSGSLGLVQVAGATGVGRRRFIAEALKHGPDAEWIHLAPGGVEADLPRWVKTELPDLLDTYPETPVPSWAIHTLSRWSPTLRRRAAVPSCPPEGLPARESDAVLGSAVGAVLTALTGRTLIIADAGLWPAPGPGAKMLRALTRSMREPGAVLLAAGPIQKAWDPEGVRTLRLEALRSGDLEELCAAWGLPEPAGFARWLTMITSGHPFFVHEVVRWLEEMGHLLVDEDKKEIRLLDPVSRLPVPLYMEGVMESRYRRLNPDSARILHLVSQHDGRRDAEAIRGLFGPREEDFDEAFSMLRRREFLLSRTSRHPVAMASPLWGETLRRGIVEFPRNAISSSSTENGRKPAVPPSVLAKTLKRLREVREDDPDALAGIQRRSRGRLGPAWAGVRGRLAVRVARLRLAQEKPAKVRLWTRWGLERLPPARHPSLRRGLWRIGAETAAGARHPEEALGFVGRARAEALGAGHFVSAAKLRAVEAESLRRRGRLATARDQARRAETELGGMGLSAWERLAAFTLLSALIDLRDLDRAGVELEKRSGRGWNLSAVESRLDLLGKTLPAVRPEAETPTGWGWGLDHPSGWAEACRELEERTRGDVPTSQYPLLEADRLEMHLLSRIRENPEDPAIEQDMERAGAYNHALGAGERNRFLAHVLGPYPVHDLAPFQTWFRSHLLHPVGAAPQLPEVHLVFLGRPRVEEGISRWPLSLWPEWWMCLWARLVSAELRGSPVPRKEAARLLAETTTMELSSAVYEGNELLHRGARIGGGIKILEEELVLDWTGLQCDAKEVVELLRKSRSVMEKGELRKLLEKILSRGAGPYLPGVDEPAVNGLRALLAGELERALALRLEMKAPVPPEKRVEWLESFWGWLNPDILASLRGRNRRIEPRSQPAFP